jgi:hypothetical protein
MNPKQSLLVVTSHVNSVECIVDADTLATDARHHGSWVSPEAKGKYYQAIYSAGPHIIKVTKEYFDKYFIRSN